MSQVQVVKNAPISRRVEESLRTFLEPDREVDDFLNLTTVDFLDHRWSNFHEDPIRSFA